MPKLPTDPSSLQKLVDKHLFFLEAVECFLPLLVCPPIRLYRCLINAGCKIDAFSYVGPDTVLHAVDIGRYCSIGNRVSILSAHPNNRLTTHPFTYENIFNSPFSAAIDSLMPFSDKLPTTHIGHDVWIGAEVKIKAGVKIGHGCIIGAGSVVTKDIPDYSIVGGVPAKLIRKRFSDAQITRLQQLQWWQYNLIGLSLQWDEIDQCCDQIEHLIQQGKLTPYNPTWLKLE